MLLVALFRDVTCQAGVAITEKEEMTKVAVLNLTLSTKLVNVLT